MGGSVRGSQNYERYGKDCISGGKAGSVGVLVILQLRRRRAVVVAEIFLDAASAAFSRGSLTTERSAGGSVAGEAAVTVVALRLKMFLHERGADGGC